MNKDSHMGIVSYDIFHLITVFYSKVNLEGFFLVRMRASCYYCVIGFNWNRLALANSRRGVEISRYGNNIFNNSWCPSTIIYCNHSSVVAYNKFGFHIGRNIDKKISSFYGRESLRTVFSGVGGFFGNSNGFFHVSGLFSGSLAQCISEPSNGYGSQCDNYATIVSDPISNTCESSRRVANNWREYQRSRGIVFLLGLFFIVFLWWWGGRAN